jgi:hypothetical protein
MNVRIRSVGVGVVVIMKLYPHPRDRTLGDSIRMPGPPGAGEKVQLG